MNNFIIAIIIITINNNNNNNTPLKNYKFKLMLKITTSVKSREIILVVFSSSPPQVSSPELFWQKATDWNCRKRLETKVDTKVNACLENRGFHATT